MRKYFFLLVIVVIWTAVCPLIAARAANEAFFSKYFSNDSTSSADIPVSEAPTANTPSASEKEYRGKNITVYISETKEYVTMPSEQYVVGVMAATVPHQYSPEALKAAAIAIRSILDYRLTTAAGTENHPKADVCNDPTCCLAYTDEAEHSKTHNASITKTVFDVHYLAAAETEGKVVLHNALPAEALYHPSSSGRTESFSNTMSDEREYLTSVPTPDESDFPYYTQVVSVTETEFAEKLKNAGIEPAFSLFHSEWVTDTVYFRSGRCKYIKLSGTSVSGTAFAEIFGLQSTCFSVTATASGFTVTAEGYGHGYGMSLYGAHIMASEGKTHADILKHYYTDITVGNALSVS